MRLLPPLSAKVLLPVAASLPHSCAPAVRVPAGDPGSYSNSKGGDGVRAGTAGWPLTVATVALRDIPAGTTITSSWVDEEEVLDVRIGELLEFVTICHPAAGAGAAAVGSSAADGDVASPLFTSRCSPVVTGPGLFETISLSSRKFAEKASVEVLPLAIGNDDGGNGPATGSAVVGARVDAPDLTDNVLSADSEVGQGERGGCGCAKCRVEGGMGGDRGRGPMGYDELLEAAEAAVDDDR